MDHIDALMGFLGAFDNWATALNDSPVMIAGACLLIAAIVTYEILDFIKERKPHPGCSFCSSTHGEPATRVVRRWRWRGVVALETINPVVPGHIVVVARRHTRDAGENPRVTARVMRCVAELMSETYSANVITSKGAAATQTAWHLHVHIVPRTLGDGLTLPWTGQVIEREGAAS